LADPTFDLAQAVVRSKRSSEAVARLREWLVGPAELVTLDPVPLTPRQRELITRRTETGYRRIRGAAGAGKSLVLAGRAAHLSREGRDVLVVSYTHTLGAYLQQVSSQFGVDSKRITWLGFHEWCRRVMVDTGRRAEYKALKKGPDKSDFFDVALPRA